jgi:amino acid adenylation domain-containing protein
MNELSERIGVLTTEQQALLRARLREKGLEAPSSGVRRVSRPSGSYAPLSFAQQRLWFLHQMNPESPAYNTFLAVLLRGPVDAGAVERSLQSIVARHEILRASFCIRDGQPVQRGWDTVKFRLPLVDLRISADQPAAPEPAAHWRGIANREVARPFDLEFGPPLRGLMLALGDRGHVLVLTLHHIVSDRWSVDVLMHELAASYEASVRRLPSPLPPLPVQYLDFVWHEREAMRGALVESQIAWWKERLTGAPRLELPADRTRSSVPSLRGSRVAALLEPSLVASLASLSRSEGATLFMTMLAAFQTLLLRWTNQVDVSVGTPIADRRLAETHALIGCFLNTLVLRTDLSGDPGFREALRRVRETCVESYARQDVPFERVVQELQPQRGEAGNALFRVLLVMNDLHAPLHGHRDLAQALARSGLSLEPLDLEIGTVQSDLTLQIERRPEQTTCVLEFNTDLFDATTAERLLGSFLRLLEGIAGEPDRRLSEYELLTPGQRHQVMIEWNDTATAWQTDADLPHLLASQAKRTPGSIAVESARGRLTYAELNERANQLAYKLRELGTGCDTRVAICLERSSELVIALLAVLKAGGAYVPLDPDYPPERVRFMMEDSAASILLTHSRLRERFGPGPARIICVDSEGERIAAQSTIDPSLALAPERLAYILYTSGSTGQPKGVMISQRALRNHMLWMVSAFSFGPGDAVLQKTPVGFDASVWEFYAPLLVGGRLVVSRPGAHADPAYLVRAVQEHAVTVLQLVPSVLALLAEEPGLERCTTLRAVFCGGEALFRSPAQRLQSRVPATIVNLYGPTEATVDATYWSAVQLPPRGGIPIGRPVSNLRAYVVDPNGGSAMLGAAGELYLGGEGLARGYNGRPGLTAERFVPDPFSGQAGARLYRTGDRVRWLADGNLEFLGRMDLQLKIRGNRVEPAEIESALAQHPAVRQAAVLARKGQSGEIVLVAYVTFEGDAKVAPADLCAWLRPKLPSVMLPGAFVTMDELPLGLNGKLNREALPDLHGDPASGASRASRNAVEELICEIFADALRLPRMGAESSFFESGGHSLLAIQVCSQLRRALEIELPLQIVFEHPTAARLAEWIGRLRGATAERQIVIETSSRGGGVPLSFAQHRLWFLHQMDPADPSYNIHFALRVTGDLDPRAFKAALAGVAARHEILRTCFPVRDGEPYQQVAPAGPIPLPETDLSAVNEPLRERMLFTLAARESERTFDLAGGPLWRVRLVRLGPGDHGLLVTLHHTVSDGWSATILARELTALYDESRAGRAAGLPALPIQYADYARWQRQRLTGDALDNLLQYWRGQLAGVEPLDLPTDRPRVAEGPQRGDAEPFAFPPELTSAVRGLARREGATLFMVLLASLQVLLSRYSGRTDLCVGTAVANRDREETENLMGLFVNTLVLRCRVAPHLTFREFLAQVRETALGAYAHQEAPFEKLVEILAPVRERGRTPLFQAMLVLQQATAQTFDRLGLQVSALPLPPHHARVDVNFTAVDDGTRIAGFLICPAGLFERSSLRRMLDHWQALLESIVENADRRLPDLAAMRPREREILLEDWNGKRVVYARAKLLHDRFEQEASRNPNALAVVCGKERLTYGELSRKSNQVAHALQSLGVGPEVRVALFLDRHPGMLVGLLGIAKAGGAYLPVNPSDPDDRIASLLADSRPAAIVTDETLLGRLAPGSAPAIALAPDGSVAAGFSTAPVFSAVRPENVAYVLHTSGSTGRPKGVMVEHRQIANYCDAVSERIGLQPGASFAMVLPLTVDSSQTVIFPCLSAGGVLHLIPPALALDGPALGRYFQEHGIDCMKIAPSHLAALQTGGGAAALMPRRWLVLGGEASRTSWGQELLRMAPGCAVFNHYGPTEAAVGMLTRRLSPGAASRWLVPMGSPLSNTTAYVLDEKMRLQLTGAPGELYIGGAGVARGYLQQPSLTAERFVPDPFGGVPGARLYRTGDRVRWLPEGALEFLGRLDQQVKIRGLRVEPGEIEQALGAHANVREAVVIAREHSNGERRLVAYIVPRHAPAPAEAELRAHASRRLPGHMIPTAFMTLGSMPRNQHGKLDRRALPEPVFTEEECGSPSTVVEELLAGLWEELLGVRPGRQSDFFECGGHSLLAVRLIARACDAFAVNLPLRTVFTSPTLAGLAEQVAAARREPEHSQPRRLVPGSRENAPLSFSQQRLWFLQQLDPGSTAYTVPAAVRLQGTLDVGALRRAFRAIVVRHAILRTVFRSVDGTPLQVITPPSPFPLPCVDIEALPNDAKESEFRRIGNAAAHRPFHLDHGPLLRAMLFRFGPREHALVTMLHHIVSDGWSAGLLVQEIGRVYGSAVAGCADELAEPALQYVDFARWQRESLEGGVIERELGWWQRTLAGVPAELDLPTDRPRPAKPTDRGDARSLRLSRALAESLKAFARDSRATDFMALLAVFATLLFRQSGQSDLCIGTPVAGRPRRETEDMLGCFVNALVLRCDLSGNPSFRDLVGRIRETALSAFDHQELPFERLVENLQPRRVLDRTPLFQVAFVFQNVPRTGLNLPDLRLEPIDFDTGTAKFDLTLAVVMAQEGFVARLEYSTDLFDANTIERMLSRYLVLLEAALANPDTRLADLPLLTPHERHQVVVEWNATAVAYPDERSIPELFREVAAAHPDAVAIEAGGERISYAELDHRTDCLAHRLHARGVRPEVPVAVCMERSKDLIVALLAVIKAGGFYVALDPSWPAARIATLLADAGAGLVLASARSARRLEEAGADPMVVDEALADTPFHNVPTRLCPDNLAYISYTSGSTGGPKGVAVTHRNVVRLVRNCDYARLGPDEVMLQYAPISFDASTFEIWGALLNGARLVVGPGEMASLADLGGLVETAGVTTMWLTSGLFRLMVDEQFEHLRGVRQLLAGGDVLPPAQVRKLLRQNTACHVINGYGPTENTTFSCCHTVRDADCDGPIPIGRPIANSRAYVLDANLSPSPIGVPGELCLAGDGLARGYAGRAALSAEQFVPDPFAIQPGQRMYRTGDRARWLPDGTLQFRGRLDAQVKIRGFRVEPGEIEAVLETFPAVRSAGVVVLEDEWIGRRLVAFVVPHERATLAVEQLRHDLQSRLPDYMIPTAIVLREDMPLSPNGKVDRRALAALPVETLTFEDYVGPCDVVEQTIAEFWTELLGIEQVSVHASFFEMGGHSLLATQLASRLERAFQAPVPLRVVFELPTIAGMAEYVRFALRPAQPAAPVDVPMLAQASERSTP